MTVAPVRMRAVQPSRVVPDPRPPATPADNPTPARLALPGPVERLAQLLLCPPGAGRWRVAAGTFAVGVAASPLEMGVTAALAWRPYQISAGGVFLFAVLAGLLPAMTAWVARWWGHDRQVGQILTGQQLRGAIEEHLTQGRAVTDPITLWDVVARYADRPTGDMR